MLWSNLVVNGAAWCASLRARGPGEFLVRKFVALFSVALLATCLTGCGAPEQPGELEKLGIPLLQGAGQLDAIKARGELVIATRNSPTNWYIDRDGQPAGPEHDLATAFAESLGVEPRFVVLDSVDDVLKAVRTGRADLAAASITRTDLRQYNFRFGPDYAEITQQVVCNDDNKPRAVADLPAVDRLVVAAGTSYLARLSEIANSNPKLGLHWRVAEDVGTEQLLARVAREDIGCTIADSNIVALNRRYHPSLLVMFAISEPQHLAWPMPRNAARLQQAAEAWLKQFKDQGRLAALEHRYYGFIGRWNFVDKHTLVQRIDNIYPKYDQYFAKAAESYELDPWLLAGQAYQESHWNPKATSPTGVRGIMMLTKPTARALGVANRLDPRQSIMGGAEYLRKMMHKLPDDIAAPDRAYLALAAYTIGFYHLRDAMRLTERLGRNPHDWQDVADTLPLLMRKPYYSTLPYGYARGTVAVRYVQRIRDYSDVIGHVLSTGRPTDSAST